MNRKVCCAAGLLACLTAFAWGAGLKPIAGSAPAALQLVQEQSAYSIRDAQVIVDKARQLDITQLRAMESSGAVKWAPKTNLNFGFSTNRYWLKVPVVNHGATTTDWALEFSYPMIQDLRFYQVENGRIIAQASMGRLQPFGARPVDHWSFIFNFYLPPGKSCDFYVMAQSVGHIGATMHIYTHDALLSRSIRQAIWMGLYAGIILAMVLYNFFLFISTRDRTYLFGASGFSMGSNA